MGGEEEEAVEEEGAGGVAGEPRSCGKRLHCPTCKVTVNSTSQLEAHCSGASKPFSVSCFKKKQTKRGRVTLSDPIRLEAQTDAGRRPEGQRVPVQGQAEDARQTGLQDEAAGGGQAQGGPERVQAAVPLRHVSGVGQLGDAAETGAGGTPVKKKGRVFRRARRTKLCLFVFSRLLSALEQQEAQRASGWETRQSEVRPL